jgi:hypothetical protein
LAVVLLDHTQIHRPQHMPVLVVLGRSCS